MLSVTEANELAGDRARVSVDLEDPRLWRVWRAGGVQVHAPMTREAWLAFLATGEAGLGAVDVSAVGEQAEPPTAQALVQSADGTMRCGRCGLHADQCTCGAGSPVRQVCLATARAMAGGLASRGVKSAALEEAMREHFSPAAVAAVAALLTHPASRVRNAAVARELEWFAGHLVDMLGVDEFKALCTEAGL
jgi:hypothetical protein